MAQSSINIMLENLEEDHFLPLWLHLPIVNAHRYAIRVGACFSPRLSGLTALTDPMINPARFRRF